MDIEQLARVELPKTLAEAVERIDNILDPEDKKNLAQTQKEDLEVTHLPLRIGHRYPKRLRSQQSQRYRAQACTDQGNHLSREQLAETGIV